MVTGHKPLVFEEKIETDEICVVGLTSPINGYPLGGKYGEDVCEMTIVYKNGHKQSITLKNGIHITTAFALNGSSRIDPVAEKAKRFIKFGYDKNYEVYVMNRLRIKTESGEIERVEFTLKNEDYLPLIYGIFAL